MASSHTAPAPQGISPGGGLQRLLLPRLVPGWNRPHAAMPGWGQGGNRGQGRDWGQGLLPQPSAEKNNPIASSGQTLGQGRLIPAVQPTPGTNEDYPPWAQDLHQA